MGGGGMSESTTMKFLNAIALLSLICNYVQAYQRDECKKEAVQRGYAEYVVDEYGETTWKWKEPK